MARKPFMFRNTGPYAYQLVVFAESLAKARDYVRREAIGSHHHRGLKFVGEGEPKDAHGWHAARA